MNTEQQSAVENFINSQFTSSNFVPSRPVTTNINPYRKDRIAEVINKSV